MLPLPADAVGNPSSAHARGRARARRCRGGARATVAGAARRAAGRGRLHQRRAPRRNNLALRGVAAARRPARIGRGDADRARVGAGAARTRCERRGARVTLAAGRWRRAGRAATRRGRGAAARARRSSRVGLANGEIGTVAADRRDRAPCCRGARRAPARRRGAGAWAACRSTSARGVDLCSLSATSSAARRASARCVVRRGAGAARRCSPAARRSAACAPGTENVAGIVGFGAAARAAAGAAPSVAAALRERLWRGLGRRCGGVRAPQPGATDVPAEHAERRLRRAARRGAGRGARSRRASRCRSARPAPPARPSRRTCCAPSAATTTAARGGRALQPRPGDHGGGDRRGVGVVPRVVARMRAVAAGGARSRRWRAARARRRRHERRRRQLGRGGAAGRGGLRRDRRLAAPVGDEAPSDSGCCSLDDFLDARRVAEQLGIPYYVMDFRDDVPPRRRRRRSSPSTCAGRTPNPCARCNQHVKFGLLLASAPASSAPSGSPPATTRVVRDAPTADARCCAASTRDKDQSYFLFAHRPRGAARGRCFRSAT